MRVVSAITLRRVMQGLPHERSIVAAAAAAARTEHHTVDPVLAARTVLHHTVRTAIELSAVKEGTGVAENPVTLVLRVLMTELQVRIAQSCAFRTLWDVACRGIAAQSGTQTRKTAKKPEEVCVRSRASGAMSARDQIVFSSTIGMVEVEHVTVAPILQPTLAAIETGGVELKVMLHQLALVQRCAAMVINASGVTATSDTESAAIGDAIACNLQRAMMICKAACREYLFGS